MRFSSSPVGEYHPPGLLKPQGIFAPLDKISKGTYITLGRTENMTRAEFRAVYHAAAKAARAVLAGSKLETVRGPLWPRAPRKAGGDV